MNNLLFQSTTTLSDALRKGEITSEALTQAHLEQIKKVN